jgi:tetratricopeptide (TPR) repeat protein
VEKAGGASQKAPVRTRGGALAPWLACIALALLTGATYAPALRNGFVYDDRILIVEQPPPQSLADLARVFAERHWFNLPYYRPVSRFTMVLQKGVHGNDPVPYHAFNLAAGLAAGLLLLALLRQPGFGIARGPALAAAALFVAHPITSDCVYPISSGRETLIPAVMSLAALVFWLREGAAARTLALALLALALLAKEQAIVLPAVFVWADALGVAAGAPGRSPGRWLRRHAPVAAVVAGYLVLRALVFGAGEGPRVAFFAAPLGPPLTLLYTLQTVFAPFAELVYEPRPQVWLSAGRLSIALLGAAAIALTAASAGGRPRRAALFCAGFALLSLAPTANLLVQEAPFAERYGLLALAGIAGAAAAAVAGHAWTPLAARLGVVAALALVMSAAAVSRGRAPDWADDLAFHEQWLRTDPGAAQPHVGLGQWYADRGDVARSRAHYEAAIALEPGYAVAHASLGAVLLAHGQAEEALAHLERAAALAPETASTWNNLGAARARRGRKAEAEAAYERALALDPGLAPARRNLERLQRTRAAREPSR